MENEFFLNAGIPLSVPLQFGAASATNWQSLSSAMEIQATELNYSTEAVPDYFLNPNWEKSTDQGGLHFESALSSMVSSPAASNSNNISNESFVIRELIGKLGNIGGNSGEISPHSQPLLAYMSGRTNNSANTSCYSTPLNSPPKLSLPIENMPSLAKPGVLNSTVADFSADPGFAERAAKFSCFGNRSFNSRTTQMGLNNTELASRSIPNPIAVNSKVPRVLSSPSFNALGSQSRNENSSPQDRIESRNSSSPEASTVSEQAPIGESGFKTINDSNYRKRKAAPKGKAKEPSQSPPNNASKVTEANRESNSKRIKTNEGNGNAKAEEETKGSNSSGGDDKQAKTNNTTTKPPEPPKDYIHVRARRGQATDSHSLAERVRREKISERMKLLQDLVPGCNKVTGKALMLDEIINYVHSLQRQVEFLSMKLASVNTRLDVNMDSILSKDIFKPNTCLPHPVFPLDSSASTFLGHQTQQNPAAAPALHYNNNNNISNGTVSPLDSALCRNLNMQLTSSLDGFGDSLTRFPTFSEDDLQTIVQMGLGQNPKQEPALLSQSFHGSTQVSNNMKTEF